MPHAVSSYKFLSRGSLRITSNIWAKKSFMTAGAFLYCKLNLSPLLILVLSLKNRGNPVCLLGISFIQGKHIGKIMDGVKAVDWQPPLALARDYPWPLAITVTQVPLLAPGSSIATRCQPQRVSRWAWLSFSCDLGNLMSKQPKHIDGGIFSDPSGNSCVVLVGTLPQWTWACLLVTLRTQSDLLVKCFAQRRAKSYSCLLAAFW